MKLFKNEKIENKPVVLANNNVDAWKKFDGKTLLQVDEKEPIVDVKLGRNEWDGKDIYSLILEYKNQKVAFPLSKSLSLDTDILRDADQLINCVFNVRRKMVEGDAPDAPTGVEYISFGKPSGLTFDEEDSLVPVETKVSA